MVRRITDSSQRRHRKDVGELRQRISDALHKLVLAFSEDLEDPAVFEALKPSADPVLAEVEHNGRVYVLVSQEGEAQPGGSRIEAGRRSQGKERTESMVDSFFSRSKMAVIRRLQAAPSTPAWRGDPGLEVLAEERLRGENLLVVRCPSAAEELLSEGELEVTRRAVLGRTVAQISSDVGLAKATVKNYLQNAYRKLGVHTRGELGLYFLLRCPALLTEARAHE